MARATDQHTPKRTSRRSRQSRRVSPNVISDYDPIAEFEREIEGRPRLDGSNVISDYDPIAAFEREPGGRLSTPQRAASLPAPNKEPTPISAPKKKRRKAKQPSSAGAPEQHDWEEGRLFAMQELKTRGNPLDKNNQIKGWKTISDLATLVRNHLKDLSKDKGYAGPDMSTTRGKASDFIKEFERERS